MTRGVGMSPGGLAYAVFLGALSALPPLSIDMGLPGIPSIEAHLPGAAGQGALTLSLFLAGFALSPLCCGPLADRFGRRRTMAVGLIGFVLAAGLCALSRSFALLLAARLAQGVAAGACVIMPFAVVRDIFDGASSRRHLSRITAVVGLRVRAAALHADGVRRRHQRACRPAPATGTAALDHGRADGRCEPSRGFLPSPASQGRQAQGAEPN